MNKSKLFGMPMCFEEIILRDEMIRHNCPKRRKGVFKTKYYFDGNLIFFFFEPL